MIHLKTKSGFDSMRFAVLVEPNVPVRSDEELYKAVAAHGKAVIHEFERMTQLKEQPTIITPNEFEATWRGD